MHAQLRIARPVSNLPLAQAMYCAGLELQVLGSFSDHAGFDGVMLGGADLNYHFEFTQCRQHPVAPAATVEDLIVFYLPDAAVWEQACARMLQAGFCSVRSFNSYWDRQGRSFADADGYRTVLQNADWSATARPSLPFTPSRMPHR